MKKSLLFFGFFFIYLVQSFGQCTGQPYFRDGDGDTYGGNFDTLDIANLIRSLELLAMESQFMRATLLLDVLNPVVIQQMQMIVTTAIPMSGVQQLVIFQTLPFYKIILP